MKVLERVSTSLSIAVLALCCVAFLLFGWSATGWKALSIPTGSMRPAIPPGSLVLMHRVPTSTLKVGDVITYINPLEPKTTLSHRIIKMYKLPGSKVESFVTKGDANKIADIPITSGSVLGKVVWHAPDIGGWLLDMKKPIVILPIIYIAATLLCIEEIQRLSDYFKLSQPYRLLGFVPSKERKKKHGRGFQLGTALSICFVMIGSFLAAPAWALLSSNTVALTNNTLIVKSSSPSPPPQQCANNNAVNVNSTSNQSASSGSANVSGSSGAATSGNASNTNSSSVTIQVTNNC